MGKRILILLIIFFLFTVSIKAKNKVVIKISCTIPPVVELNSAKEIDNESHKEITQKNTIVQMEEKVKEGKKVIIKTILVK